MQNQNNLHINDGLNELDKLPLGEVQWKCLDTIAKKYRDVSLKRISNESVFEDPVWLNHVPLEVDIKWDRKTLKNGMVSGQFSEDQYPLMLLCKIATYRNIVLLGRSNSWFRRCQAFYNFFSEILRVNNILTGSKNEIIRPLSDLTCDDIRLAAEIHLAKTNGKLSKAPFHFLDTLKDLPVETIQEAPFFSYIPEFPWQEEGVTVDIWVKQLKTSFGFSESKKSYPPISLDNVGKIVKNASLWLDNLEVLKDIFQAIKKDEEENGVSRDKRVNKYVTDEFIAKHGLALNNLLPIRLKDIKSTPKNSVKVYIGKQIDKTWLADLIRLANGAAIWIILLTTGLRNVDLRNLRVGSCKQSNRSDLLNYLVTDIKKTGQKNYVLPVPPQTKAAIEILENIRRDFDCPFLATTSKKISRAIKEEQSAMHDGRTLNKLLWDFLDHYEIPRFVSEDDETEATVHCVRSTLAGWIGANSHMAILIVRKLFGHTNIMMPDAYLSHNPIIIKQRQENITQAQESLAEDMADGMATGKLSGTKGKQMLRGAKFIEEELRIECKSITEMDMHVSLKERLKELLLQRIGSGDLFALLTPMGVVCMRNSSNTADTPCAKQANHEKRRDKNISKEITDALGTLPNPAHCIGKDCSDAVLSEKWSMPLLETFEYYINYLKGMGDQNIDMKFEAEMFVKEYGPLLKDIYEDEVDCFD